MKIIFSFSNISSLGDKQAQVSEAMIAHLKAKKDFYVQFGNDKTPAQLRGYWRLCSLLVSPLQRKHGEVFDKELVSDLVKRSCGYSTVIKGKEYSKSLKHASRDHLNTLIEKLHFMCEYFGLKDYELTSAERKALVEFYETKN